MANEQNLKGHGFNEIAADKQREIARQGAYAAAAEKRRKRTFREIAAALAEKGISVKNADGTTDKVTYDVAVVDAQFRKAITKGDTSAARYIAELLGDLETQGTSAPTQIVVNSDKTAANLAKFLGRDDEDNQDIR